MSVQLSNVFEKICSGTSPLRHLYSRDTSIQGTQNLVRKNVHIIFLFVSSVEETLQAKETRFLGPVTQV